MTTRNRDPSQTGAPFAKPASRPRPVVDHSRKEALAFKVSFLDAKDHNLSPSSAAVIITEPVARKVKLALFQELNDWLRRVETGSTKSVPKLGMAKKPIDPFTRRIHEHNRDFKNLKMSRRTR